MKNTKAKKNGYTLIETMIAVSLFIIIVMIGMNALLNANVVAKKSQNMRSIMDNMSYVMDDMSRNLRTGYNYDCITGLPPGSIPAQVANAKNNGVNCLAIAFEPAGGTSTIANPINDQWVYYISGGKIFKISSIPLNSGTYSNSSNYIQVTPDEVSIDSVNSGFFVVGESPGDNLQPLITIHLVGTITSQGVTSPFDLQTSVSQRSIDF